MGESESSSGGYMSRAERNDWRTPKLVLDVVRDVFGRSGWINLDPCASPQPAHHFAGTNWTNTGGFPVDGLGQSWAEAQAFVNPPFDQLAAWCEKAAHEAVAGAEVVLLLPSRTDTRYWHQHVARSQAVAFWRGRLRFEEAEASCPFPVAFAYWGPERLRFEAAFSRHAWVVRT